MDKLVWQLWHWLLQNKCDRVIGHAQHQEHSQRLYHVEADQKNENLEIFTFQIANNKGAY